MVRGSSFMREHMKPFFFYKEKLTFEFNGSSLTKWWRWERNTTVEQGQTGLERTDFQTQEGN